MAGTPPPTIESSDEGRSAHQHVVVLFTDLVGSTALSQSVSPDAAERIRRAHFSALRRAIAATRGTEVKNLGDGLMVTFGSGTAALACALSMQQEVDLDNRREHRDHPLGLRVGVSTGEATFEDDDYFGEPVIEASRLCAACQPGQILVAELVRLLAGRRAEFRFVPVGALELKGLSEPVETLEVGWEPLPDTVQETAVGGIPLAQELSKGPTVGRVVGREEEQDLLLDAFKRVMAGDGREVVFVSGEPGIGKTTLVGALARSAYDLGACVLWGHFDEEGSIPYRGVTEALAHYVVHAPEEVLQQHLDEDGGVLAMLVPALSRRIPDLPPDRSADPETQRFLLFSSVVNLVARAATSEAVVLVFDDLQWADEPSLQLLRHLITSSRGQRLLIVGTCRDVTGRADAFTQFLAAMRREQGSSFVELSYIDEAAVLSFLETAAGQSLGPNGERLARFLHHETDGNPFFVSEMLRHLSETGTFFQDADGQWQSRDDVTTMELPTSIRQVVRARVERLGEESSRLLSLAAMIGREFDLDVLSAASERDEDDVLDLLDAALAAGLVAEVGESPGRYRFAHALIGHTLDQDLGATRRARLHRKVAAALEDLCKEEFGNSPLDITGWESWSTIRQRRLATRVGHLAYQWTATGDPADGPIAAAYCTRAGQICPPGVGPPRGPPLVPTGLGAARSNRRARRARRSRRLDRIGHGDAARRRPGTSRDAPRRRTIRPTAR